MLVDIQLGTNKDCFLDQLLTFLGNANARKGNFPRKLKHLLENRPVSARKGRRSRYVSLCEEFSILDSKSCFIHKLFPIIHVQYDFFCGNENEF